MNIGNPIPTITLSSGLNHDVACANLGDGTPFYNPTMWRFVSDSAGSTVTGFESDVLDDASLGIIRNDGTGVLTITHRDTRSASANRVTCPSGLPVVLPPGLGTTFTFDSTAGIAIQGHGRPLTSSSVPSRLSGTAFQPSTTRDAWVSYGVEVSSTVSVLSTTVHEGYVTIKVGPTSTPTVEHQRSGGALSTGGLTVSETSKHVGAVSAFVPAGSWVLLTAVTVSGSPTIVLDAIQVETLIG